MKKLTGFGLIDTILFIILIGILGSTIFMTFNQILIKLNDVIISNRALNFATQRMELILGQRRVAGYNAFTDLCQTNPPTICSLPAAAGYTVNVTGLPVAAGSDTATVSVTVAGPLNIAVTLTTQVYNW